MGSINNKRIEWLDSIRAIGVLLVIFGHYYNKSTLFFVLTSPIKVPLLFAISGFVFSKGDGNTVTFLKKILHKLVIPWIALGWLPELIGSVVGISDKSMVEVLYLAISGKTMWYFPCLIVAEVIFFYIVKFGKKLRLICILCLIIGIGGYWLSMNDIFTFGMINRAMVVQLYIVLGYALKNQWPKLKTISIVGLVSLYLGLCFLSLTIFPGQVMDVHNNQYYSIPLCGIMIILGCTCMFLMAERMNNTPKFLVFLGQNTLVLWMMNGYFLFMLNTILKHLHIEYSDNLLTAIVKVIYSCIGCSVLAVIINRYMPELVGKKRIASK